METLYKLVCENGGYDKASATLRSRSPSVVISLPSLHLPFRIVRCSAPDTQVCEQKRWIAISEKLGLTAYSSAPTVIKGHYQKLLHERRCRCSCTHTTRPTVYVDGTDLSLR